MWGHLEVAPFDGNHETAAAYEKDPSPLKVNLGRGVYKDDNGKDWVLPSVAAAAKAIKVSFNYEPFSGVSQFRERATEFAWGDIAKGRVATVQTISGTGALRVGADFLFKCRPASVAPVVYISEPSYVNHFAIFGKEWEIRRYRYEKDCQVDWEGLLHDVQHAPPRSVFLLHAAAHNPTGADPTPSQWEHLARLFVAKGHVAFFDSAYQGFASGNPTTDAFAFRTFGGAGVDVLLAQSFSKNFGLYGQRVGALQILCASPGEVSAVLSQLNLIIRPMYSNPPSYGATLVAHILGDPTLRAQWEQDVATMAHRLQGARRSLVDRLKELGSPHSWEHISSQIGMFAYSGLTRTQVQRLRESHVYMNWDGRLSVSGINSHNLPYLAQAFHSATLLP